MTRRTFLQLTGVSAAGLVLSFDALGSLAHADAATFEPSGFIRIDGDGSTTLWVTKVEMGQGINTALPMILAEELDADWKRVQIRYAKFDPKRYGSMDTGGSYSVRGSWDPLRKAGAAARAMLVAAAARRWSVDSAACRTESGFVIHDASRKRVGYGELVAAAAALPVPKQPVLKDRMIGWGADGATLFVISSEPGAMKVERVNVSTGKRTPWKTLHPTHAAVTGLTRVIATTDGYLAYTYSNDRSELYLIQGLK